jgi:hypothetical protein
MMWSDDEFDWFKTSDGYLYYVRRKPRIIQGLSGRQIALGNLVTFFLTLLVACEVAAMTIFIMFALM